MNNHVYKFLILMQSTSQRRRCACRHIKNHKISFKPTMHIGHYSRNAKEEDILHKIIFLNNGSFIDYPMLHEYET